MTRTILVFDSGLGGLTVFREVAKVRPDACLYLSQFFFCSLELVFLSRVPSEILFFRGHLLHLSKQSTTFSL